jgi:four helix bundle protein
MKDKKDNDLVDRTMEFALRIVRMFVALPQTEEACLLGKQVLCSGKSVGATYREAQRALAEIVPSPKLAALRQENDELLALFTTISKNAKR